MLTFYNNPMSPNCFKVKVLLNELDTEYEQTDMGFADQTRPAFAAKFPNAKLPAIEDGDVRIAESGAIAQYLARKCNRLMPTDTRNHALALQALSLEASLLAPVFGGMGIFGQLMKPEKDRDVGLLERLMPEAQRVGQVLGALLDGRDYFAEEFSIADIQMYAAASKAVGAGVITSPPDNLVSWVGRMGERASVVQASQQYPPYQQ